MTPKEVMSNLNELIPGSKYFRWSEALWMAQVQAFALPSEAQISNIITTATALDKVREHYNRPMVVHSWLRTPRYNQLIGGAMKSYHMEGKAVDFHVDGLNVGVVQQELSKRKDIWPFRGEHGVSWVHLDTAGDRWFYP
jgi:hypothetical protein